MTTAQELDDRYGRTPRRRLPWIIAGVIAVLAIAALGWTVVANQMNAVGADDLGFELTDEHSVTVHYQVTPPAGRDVICIVEALDEEFGIVGWKVVEIPATEEHAQAITTVVPTVAEATTGLVNSCKVA